jgi:hypothetical protein
MFFSDHKDLPMPSNNTPADRFSPYRKLRKNTTTYRMTGTLHEVHTFISRSLILGMRHVSNTNYIHFVFNNDYLKNLPFMRCGKTWQSGVGH